MVVHIIIAIDATARGLTELYNASWKTISIKNEYFLKGNHTPKSVEAARGREGDRLGRTARATSRTGPDRNGRKQTKRGARRQGATDYGLRPRR